MKPLSQEFSTFFFFAQEQLIDYIGHHGYTQLIFLA